MSSYELPGNPFCNVAHYDYDTLVKPPPKQKLDQSEAVEEIRGLIGSRNKSGKNQIVSLECMKFFLICQARTNDSFLESSFMHSST